MQVVIIGINGRMGSLVKKILAPNYEIIGYDIAVNETTDFENIIQSKDIIIVDFSNHSVAPNLVKALNKGIPVISGTTGFRKEEFEEILNSSALNQTPFYWSCNFANGIQLFKKIALEIKEEYPKMEISETHAITKKDVPSGTAIAIADALKIPIEQIKSFRVDNTNAIHEIVFSSELERISIKHEILNKEAFLKGFYQKFTEFVKEL